MVTPDDVGPSMPLTSPLLELKRRVGDGARHGLGRRAAVFAGRLRHMTYLALEYPPSARSAPRYGYGAASHPRLATQLAGRDDIYARSLEQILGKSELLYDLPREEVDPAEPAWINEFLPGLDSAALYTFVQDRAPASYLEIGSGNSTRFVARAKRDADLSTRITSIDPYPRAGIDGLCHKVVREPLEFTDLGIFDTLSAGDVLFFDGSHRVFTNSDVATFFLDVLPDLPPGLLVGIHDIYLPDDYPPGITDRFYSEQYLLACYLLAGGSRVRPVLPAHYVSTHPRLGRLLDPLWQHRTLEGVGRHGVAFWFELA